PMGHQCRRACARRRFPLLCAWLLPALQCLYIAWDKIARDRDSFTAWIRENVLAGKPEDFARHAVRRAANAA
ncbi:hypothetical protein NZA98_19065, partial [Escherichia coli]|nr:hypothetical protein [Escherichia coli]